ncbi:MAG: transposase [Candidatus Andersenbacteria bacterium]
MGIFRKDPLTTGQVYHVMNKSIAGFQVFPSPYDYHRMRQLIFFFRYSGDIPRFSQFTRLQMVKEKGVEATLAELAEGWQQTASIIAYCLMPTHIHIVVKQLAENGISVFMSNILNAYARYFNTKYKRKGPLWEGRFKNVLIQSDEQLLHVTRYVHLNPVTAGIVERPLDWEYSSYVEYIATAHPAATVLTETSDLLALTGKEYERFTEDHIDYQRELAKIKSLILE